jgi:hypothetical protein
VQPCSRISNCALPQRLEAKVEAEECDADKDCHDHACLFRFFADEQDPTRDRQLAAHLERLPEEVWRLVVARQEGGRAAQRGRNARAQRLAARPQQHRVQQGDAHRPQGKHRKGRGAGALVLLGIARERQVGVQVPSR